MTPARLAANRHNALQSTGPRTARGKAQSRMNSLRTGRRAPSYRKLWFALLEAPSGETVEETARAILTPEQWLHPKYADLVEAFWISER
jgi:hypothetical protein